MIHSMINQEIENAIIRHTKNICSSLGAKYNFDVQEAIAYISNNTLDLHNEKLNEKVGVFTNANDIILSSGASSERDEPQKKKRGRPKKNVDEVKEDKPKKKRGRPKKENKVTIVDDTDEEKEPPKPPTTEEMIVASMSNVINDDGELHEESVSDEEKEINVVEWTWKGDKYLKDDDDNVYCHKTHEIIGKYSQENDSIIS